MKSEERGTADEGIADGGESACAEVGDVWNSGSRRRRRQKHSKRVELMKEAPISRVAGEVQEVPGHWC